MAAPQPAWYDLSNNRKDSWDIGIVVAGESSPDSTFLIWNNKGGKDDVADMVNCSLTTKDLNGQDTGIDLVKDKWVWAQCISMGETMPTQIGGSQTKAIKAGGSAPLQTIKGTANDGTDAAVVNYSKVTLKVEVPTLAIAGTVKFYTRVAYQYT